MCNCRKNRPTESKINPLALETANQSADNLVGKTVVVDNSKTGVVKENLFKSNGDIIGYIVEGLDGDFRILKSQIVNII